MAKITVKSLGWSTDHATEESEEPNALLGGIVYVDGVEVKDAMGVTFTSRGADFAEAQIHVHVSGFEVESLSPEEWAEVGGGLAMPRWAELKGGRP